MSTIIDIDFDRAREISKQIESEKFIADKMITKCNDLDNSLKGIPAIFLQSVLSDISTFKSQVSKISQKIGGISSSFDSSIESYYIEENGDLGDSQSIVIDELKTGSGDKFTWGYQRTGSGIRRVSRDEIEEYLLSKGATQVWRHGYEVTLNGVTYKYDTGYNFLYVGNRKIKCDFYLSNYHTDQEITNVVTLLGGTGERAPGAIRYDRIKDNISFSEQGLLVLPYSGDWDWYINTNEAMTATRFGQQLFDVSGNATNSIIGYSEGAQVTAQVISENPDVFDNVVFVNGSSYAWSNYVNYVRNGYEGFKNADNVIYLETVNGWVDPYAKEILEQRAVVSSINSLIENGVDPSNITLVTNDQNLSDKLMENQVNINFENSMPPVSKGEFTYFGHGKGAWDIFNDSEIINFLSICGKGGSV